MFNQSYSRLNLPPEVVSELEKIDQETSESNMRQAYLGERVPFPQQSLGVLPEDFTDHPLLVRHPTEPSEDIGFIVSPKERLILKIAKDPTN